VQNLLLSQELADFVAEIRWLFTAGQIRPYLDCLGTTKFLGPKEPDLQTNDQNKETEEGFWPAHPVLGAQEDSDPCLGTLPARALYRAGLSVPCGFQFLEIDAIPRKPLRRRLLLSPAVGRTLPSFRSRR
jgi:hypothetical protein